MDLEKVTNAFTPYGIHIHETKSINKEAAILYTNKGPIGFYSSRYEFRELGETNIPFSIYQALPSEVKKILILFKDKLYWIDKDKIPKSPRINKKLKLVILPIHLSLLEPFEIVRPSHPSFFLHLHLHSDYSILDGVTQCKSYLAKAHEFGMPAMAVTDHGNVSAHMELQLRSKEFGVKPIFGVETYITKDASKKDGDHRSSNHIVLLAKNDIGYKNLLILQKFSWAPENYYYRPRIDFKTLAEHREGLVVLTACLKGLIAKEVLRERLDLAQKRLVWLQKLFAEDVYLEIQMHQIIYEEKDIQAIYNQALLHFSDKLGMRTVLTNDVHYLEEGMGKVQSKVIKMKSESDLAETYCDSIWFKNYEDMRSTRNERCPYISKTQFNQAVEATFEIADKCDYEIPTGGLRIPKIDVGLFPKYEQGFTELDYLRFRIKQGLAKKELSGLLSTTKEEYLKRIEIEIDAFVKMDVISYIFIYDDLIRYLKKQGCLCSLRGSANGSVVLWLIGLSIVDPLKFNILFERFISPARIEARMADIDIDLDISHNFRDIAVNYLKEKYGEENICSVGSFNRTQLKAAIKGLARAEATQLKKKIELAKTTARKEELEAKLIPFSFQEMNKLTKAMPDTIDEIPGSSVEPWFEQNKTWIDKYVRPILGNAYAESLHPAGIVISPEPLHHWLPIRTNKLSVDKGGSRVFATQWENSHTGVEHLNERGVMVMDVLGVKTLSILDQTMKLIKERHGIKITLETIPLDNDQVYKTLSKGENIGFFQLGKESLKGLFRKIKPDNIEDLIFMIAADRPGPLASGAFEKYAARKHGEEDVTYIHKSLKPVLEDTLGVLTYSEHIMKTASAFAKMNPIDSEKMRKIIKSKKKEDFLQFKERFIKGVTSSWKGETNIQGKAEKVWDDMMGFSEYAFPKAHATSYALIANATQYLKVHYPTEFFCAFLEEATDDEYALIKSVSEKYYNVKYMLPEINTSKPKFTIHNNKIVWSLKSIKGIGYKAALEISEKQPFKSFEDFFERINKRTINIRVMKTLVISNAFRKFEKRNAVAKILNKLRGAKEIEQLSFQEWQLESSKIMPYIKQSVRELFPAETDNAMTFERFSELRKGQRVLVAGIIETIRSVKSKRGMMIIMKISDSGENFNVVCWNDMYKRLVAKQIMLNAGSAIKVSGFKGESYMGEQQIALGSEKESYIKILR